MPKCKPDSRNVKFTREEDHRLVKFIAMHDVAGTRGRHKAFFDVLGPKAFEDLDWSRHRSAESWRSRYKSKTCAFDQAARNYRTGESRPRPVKVPPRLPTAPPTIRSMSFQRSDTAFSTDTNVTRSASWTTTTTSRSTPSVTASSVLSRAKVRVVPRALQVSRLTDWKIRTSHRRPSNCSLQLNTGRGRSTIAGSLRIRLFRRPGATVFKHRPCAATRIRCRTLRPLPPCSAPTMSPARTAITRKSTQVSPASLPITVHF
ncbi:hypothetical protein C8R43DRAFT_503800 [Mycena crocata]|nr:hypothetical protein C8R43DRAFT_503800 [Mycena crocata]